MEGLETMGFLLRLSHNPAVTVKPSDSVHRAVELMSKNRVGAIGVVDGGKFVGIFTERDVMERVVLRSLDPAATAVSKVMTSPVETIDADGDPQKALERMVDLHIRHLPITTDANELLGILSIRHLLQHQLERARSEADSLEAYYTADGIGG